MAISLETINVGVENQATGSDSLYVAFTKANNNFIKIASTASQYTNFVGSNGISTTSNPTTGTVTITNSGVLSISAGTGITTSNSNGNITISVSGFANGTLVAGVTNVGINSSTLNVSNSPIISNGVMSVNLKTIGTITPGTYVAPNVTVDEFGRVTSISNTVSTGTVTSVSFVAGDGIQLDGTNPIIDSGTLTISNDGVTRLNAGPGIELSGRTGEITVSASNPNPGTVARVEVTSNTLTITNGIITSTGTINIELPSSEDLSGNLSANYVTVDVDLSVGGNASINGNLIADVIDPLSGNLIISANANVVGNLILTGNVSTTSGNLNVTGNANISSKLTVAGNANVSGNVVANNISSTHNLTVGNSTVGNITSYDIYGSNTVVVANTGYLLLNTVTNNSKFVGFQAPSSISGSYIIWQLPSTSGNSGQFLTQNGGGVMNWATVASSSAPTLSTDPGVAGQIAYDSTHIYVCIATNSWIRADAAAW